MSAAAIMRAKDKKLQEDNASTTKQNNKGVKGNKGKLFIKFLNQEKIHRAQKRKHKADWSQKKEMTLVFLAKERV